MNQIEYVTKLLKQVIKEQIKRVRSSSVSTLYVFDFDHTIAHTVEERYKLPDGRVDLGAFSHLSDETTPKEPFFELFKAKVKSSPQTTYVLTARPGAVKKPMLKWLETHDIAIDPDRIVCLGNGAPNKKRDWIMNKVEQLGVGKVMFWDDREKNVLAVQSLTDTEKYPTMQGIKVKAVQA